MASQSQEILDSDNCCSAFFSGSDYGGCCLGKTSNKSFIPIKFNFERQFVDLNEIVKIKKIECGGKFTLLWGVDKYKEEKIYSFGTLRRVDKCQLDLSSIMEPIETIHCSYESIFVITKSHRIYVCGDVTEYINKDNIKFDSPNITTFIPFTEFNSLNKKIKIFKTSPICYHFMILINENNEDVLYGNGKQAFGINNNNNSGTKEVMKRVELPKEVKRIKLLATGDGTTFFVTNDNYLYGVGSNTFGALVQPGDVYNVDKFTKFETPFQGKPIKLIESGFFHLIVVMENNDIYGGGYNCNNQCCFNRNNGSSYSYEYVKVNISDVPIVDVKCTSLATVFTLEDKTFVGFGEFFANNDKGHCFGKDMYCKSDSFKEKRLINRVALGGWHLVAYYQDPDLESLIAKHFQLLSLKRLFNSEEHYLNDIDINFI
ncbi:hypothetical protein ABK040_008224 [Willaertia magna]